MPGTPLRIWSRLRTGQIAKEQLSSTCEDWLYDSGDVLFCFLRSDFPPQHLQFFDSSFAQNDAGGSTKARSCDLLAWDSGQDDAQSSGSYERLSFEGGDRVYTMSSLLRCRRRSMAQLVTQQPWCEKEVRSRRFCPGGSGHLQHSIGKSRLKSTTELSPIRQLSAGSLPDIWNDFDCGGSERGEVSLSKLGEGDGGCTRTGTMAIVSYRCGAMAPRRIVSFGSRTNFVAVISLTDCQTPTPLLVRPPNIHVAAGEATRPLLRCLGWTKRRSCRSSRPSRSFSSPTSPRRRCCRAALPPRRASSSPGTCSTR